jgi:hypothetical protein
LFGVLCVFQSAAHLKPFCFLHDILNEENGGITTVSDFESGDVRFLNRQRLQVYLTDAESF